MIGKQFEISGMVIEIVADDSEKWQALNITSKQTVYIKKSVLQNAIKLGKAEEILRPER